MKGCFAAGALMSDSDLNSALPCLSSSVVLIVHPVGPSISLSVHRRCSSAL